MSKNPPFPKKCCRFFRKAPALSSRCPTALKSVLCYLLAVHLSALAAFGLFRLILLALFRDSLPLPEESGNLWRALLMGLRFDNVVACYAAALPLLLLTAACFFPRLLLRGTATAVHLFFCTAYSVLFFISAADIPYFVQFFKHLDASVWNWLGEPAFVLQMVAQEKSFIVYFLLYLLAAIAFCRLLLFYKRRFLHPGQGSNAFPRPASWRSALLFLLLIGLCLPGIRGRTSRKSPIRVGTAFFCSNPFLNQLGLNANYVFLHATLKMSSSAARRIRMMDEREAFALMRADLGLPPSAQTSLDRTISGRDTAGNRLNVVVILMESLAMHYMETPEATPFLNRLAAASVYYPECFSAGIHTMNGQSATAFSLPALMNQHPFKDYTPRPLPSLPAELKQRGYSTYYFTTHDEQFDNAGGWLTAGGIETIVSEKDYPAGEIRSNLGCTDGYMLQNSLRVLAGRPAGKPFFALYLTASNHQPYIIPEDFHPRQADPALQAVEYSDHALAGFFAAAREEPWFGQTLFVLLGDHGHSLPSEIYDISLDYHRIPLLFYAPGLLAPEKREELAAQIDVYPTVMGLLGCTWTNHTLGHDLRRERRKYVSFASDNAYCCVDSLYYFVARESGMKSLYRRKERSGKDLIGRFPAEAGAMDRYSRAFLQVGQALSDR